MTDCGVFTGILFSRKPCGQNATVHCGRCNIPLCGSHLRPQPAGPFLCPSCDAYESDDNWSYSDTDERWQYNPTAAGQDSSSAGDFSDEDRAGFTAASPLASAAADGREDSGSPEESDFDAS